MMIRRALYRKRLLVNGERAQSKPVNKCLKLLTTPEGTFHVCDHSEDGGNTSALSRFPMMLSCGGWKDDVKALKLNSDISSRGVPKQYVCYRAADINEFSTCSLVKSVCGLLNTGSGGSVYLGVNKADLIKGCMITQKEVNSKFIRQLVLQCSFSACTSPCTHCIPARLVAYWRRLLDVLFSRALSAVRPVLPGVHSSGEAAEQVLFCCEAEVLMQHVM